jgi:hypothetical protein
LHLQPRNQVFFFLSNPSPFYKATASLPLTRNDFNKDHYLPVYPRKKLEKWNVQLRLCGTYGRPTQLPSVAYVKINDPKTVPLHILREKTRADGLVVMFQQKSYDMLRECADKFVVDEVLINLDEDEDGDLMKLDQDEDLMKVDENEDLINMDVDEDLMKLDSSHPPLQAL